MHNLALTVILAEQRRRQCPCGAVAGRPFGFCRKCQDRNAWRRKVTARRRKASRRPVSRRLRDAVDAFFILRTVSNRLEG